MLRGLGKAQTRIDDHLVGIDSGGHRIIDCRQQFAANLGHHVPVVRNLVWSVRLHRPPVHQHPGHAGIRDDRCHVRIGAASTDVVDDACSALQRGPCHRRMHGVDTDRDSLSSKFFHYRNDSRSLDGRIDSVGAGSGRFAAYVDDVSTSGN